MKVALIITGLHTGGAEMMLYKLLQNMDRRKYEPTVITLMDLNDMGPKIQALGVKVHAIGMQRRIPNPYRLWLLVRVLKQLQPDVVHTWMYHADLLGSLAARLAGCRQIVWGIHHSNLSPEQNKKSTIAVVKLCAWLSNWLPHEVLSCSHQAARVHTAVGYKQEKVRVIPNGFDLANFKIDQQARSSVRQELGLPQSAPLVGLIARYHPLKNHLGFMAAAKQVLDQMPDVHFLLAGPEVDCNNDALVQEIAKYDGLSAHIHLLGRRDDVPRLMGALDVLASPSHGEAFPNVLGEAMACGVPCAVTNAGDSAEIVGETGRTVSVGDMPALACALLELLSMAHDERLALGQSARTRVEALFEIGHVTRQYEDAYLRCYTSH